MSGAQDFELEAQCRVVLTPHPLQRIGAFALASLVGVEQPEELESADFQAAMSQVIEDAARASVRDSKASDGFWQKASLSFFPNSPMNHPGRRKGKTAEGRPKTDVDVRDAVRSWLRMPDPEHWPATDCVLCGRAAVGFFGKRDVVLAESEAYRNSTPRGHEGMALCWPCLCCFYALPYGSRLTGGSSIALHSWDEGFVRRTARRQARVNQRLAATGDESKKQTEVREVVALDALRLYGERISDGVELLVFNNNNRGQTLDTYGLQQPLAEWLRKTCRLPELRRGFGMLVRAHSTPGLSGVVALARNAFHSPDRIVSTGASHLAVCVMQRDPDHNAARELAKLLMSFVTEVMHMNEKDLAEIRATARKLGSLLSQETGRGPLKELRAHLRNSRQLRSWLTRHAVAWAGTEHEGFGGEPLMSDRVTVLLFDPSLDNAAWFHRELLFVGVLEELARLSWRVADSEKTEDVVAELRSDDRQWISRGDEEDEQ
ncbi:hypothetical protein [Streptomyces marincola]|uniref:hypothetical protein n=1 Tax=Streptomyces marincola TaxID=2878388 RepID=UPI001CF107BE|nr:hypothetical protein [Streptomyces marincola]UCM87972.1 hypothetical protein LC193_08395 [Streptomyces marincola]